MNGGDLLSKRIQQLSTGGDEPPPRFSVTDQSNHSSVPVTEIPTIDIRLLSVGSQDELINLRSALTSWGCFQAIGHGISSSLLDDMRDQLKQFFSLPIEEKNKYSRQVREDVASLEGYGHDNVYSDTQILDWCDRYILTLLPEHKRNLNLWPKTLTSFRKVVHEYSVEIEATIHLMLKAIARSLNLAEESFITQFGEQRNVVGRFILYPVCPKPDKVLGVKAHSDASGITVILPDIDVPGLQVFKDEKWFAVPLVREALFVNLGDQMQLMSNGILKSPLHRVTANSEKDKISVVAFYLPGQETEIGPIEELISDTQPRLYRNVSNYRAINIKCYQRGEFPIDTLKLELLFGKY